jgi:hypothetical protein
MKPATLKIFFVQFFLLFTAIGFAQTDSSQIVWNEGMALYRLEKASWNAGDCVFEMFPALKDSIGGYISYPLNDQVVTTFYNRNDPNRIEARMVFDHIPKSKPISVDIKNSESTPTERELISLVTAARTHVLSNRDTFYTFYEGTGLNFIPVINGTSRQVYIVTAPNENGYLLLGNDYELRFDEHNVLLQERKLHNSLIKIPLATKEKPVTMSLHSHLLSDYPTPTDICTLLLYRELSGWKQHYVMSQKIVTIIDLEKETIISMKREIFDKIYKKK